ncbi:hypothetical protein SAMN02799631_00408 [Methylobacterium sp. 174MFSha1.1]|uniref:hypothetical protein n=1 Tax=Methylobacterium sp. 174MFSha1.1 TaxID=1502749 RepID=UPI0008E1FEB0|nr:hypothetical protein [Methylobacterium sp. 174MFSha1.1]SFU39169.1 hypothetical protein SAMN02799631_00408 [Methylobacterium sp. 174MFSha1.1]
MPENRHVRPRHTHDDTVIPAAWKCGVQLAAGYGMTVTTNQGKASASGFTIAWIDDPSAQTLSLPCTDSPFIVPCSLIDTFIDDKVHGCLSQNSVAMTAMI